MDPISWADFEAKCAEFEERCASDWMDRRDDFYADDDWPEE